MGCDIHLFTEKKMQIAGYNDGEPFWWCCDYFQLNPYKKVYDDEPKYNHKEIYGNRDYCLFGALANVRNYYDAVPICEPRGIPEDASKVIKKQADKWGLDGHSHSWLTAKELFDYQKQYDSKKFCGYVSPKDAAKLDSGEDTPGMWCQSTSDVSWVWREWTVGGCPMDNLIEAVKEKMMEEFHIWDFLSEEEKREKINQNAENFRIIFWFDN